MGYNCEGLVKCVWFFENLNCIILIKLKTGFALTKIFYTPVKERLRGLQSMYTYQEVVQYNKKQICLCPCTQGCRRTT